MDLRSKNEIKAEGSMSSMTDLVFLLLIFFIIMSTMSNSGLPVDLPSGEGSTKKSSNVDIGITPEGQYFLDSDLSKLYTYEAVEPILIQKMKSVEDKVLRIHGDKNSALQQSVNILALSKQMQWKPVLVTEAK